MKLYLRRLRLAILGKDCLWSSYFNLDEEILDHIDRFGDEFGDTQDWLVELWQAIKDLRIIENNIRHNNTQRTFI